MIDGSGHLLGRLASIIAKEVLSGQHVVVVRCEELNISGHFARNRIRYQLFLKKRCNTNPTHGPFHLRAPSKMLWRTVRGMLPHKTVRGARALGRLRTYEGVPPPWDTYKRLVVPEALRATNLRPDRPFTVLGRLSEEVGWRYADVIEKLENKRKIRSKAWYLKHKAALAQRERAALKVKDSKPELHAALVSSGFLIE